VSEALDLEQLLAGMRAAYDNYQPRHWKPLPHQLPPTDDAWEGWLLLSGRGAGKTDACAHYMVEHVKGPACMPGAAPHWMGIIAPTLGDAATSGFFGPSGVRAHDPGAQLVTREGGTVIRWRNGSECKLFGAKNPDDIERLRSGGNRCLFWLEELAAMRYMDDAFDQMTFGLRAGPHPRWVGSTTPKPRQLIKDLHDGKHDRVVVTAGITTWDNPHLPESVRRKFENRYAGTALGAQELHGRIVEQDENALWHRAQIEQFRLEPAEVPRESLKRVTVGVDPSGGAGEQGIIVVGKSQQQRAEAWAPLLDDRTCRLSPDGWGRRVVTAAVDWQADDICVEVNFGGDMAVATVRSAADALGIPIPIRIVRASLGKRARAEPVSAIAARGLHPHVGVFPELEDQQCTWVPGESDYSPDRLDADVWAVTHLGMVPAVGGGKATWGGSALAGRSLTARRAR
jgi:phage terminase large subunit-like protein